MQLYLWYVIYTRTHCNMYLFAINELDCNWRQVKTPKNKVFHSCSWLRHESTKLKYQLLKALTITSTNSLFPLNKHKFTNLYICATINILNCKLFRLNYSFKINVHSLPVCSQHKQNTWPQLVSWNSRLGSWPGW